MKNCPYCAEEIQDEAIKCRHCGEFLKKKVVETSSSVLPKIKEDTGCLPVILSLIIPGLGQLVRGEYAKGIVLFIVAVVLGLATYGIGSLVVGIASAISASSPIYKCPKCRQITDANAMICRHCGTKYKEKFGEWIKIGKTLTDLKEEGWRPY